MTKLISILLLFLSTFSFGQYRASSHYYGPGNKYNYYGASSKYNDSLYYALLYDKENLVKKYLDYGADPYAIDQLDGSTILNLAVSKPSILKLLIQYKVDINFDGWTHESPLSYAIDHCYFESAKFLLANGANKNFLNEGDNPPLFRLIGRLYKPCPPIEPVKFVVEIGADVNYQIQEGDTPLMIAAEVGNLEVAKYLISKGANKNLKNKDGLLAIDIAQKNNFKDLVNFLKLNQN